MLPSFHSLQFRIHTPVFFTLLVAGVCTLLILSRPAPAAGTREPEVRNSPPVIEAVLIQR